MILLEVKLKIMGHSIDFQDARGEDIFAVKDTMLISRDLKVSTHLSSLAFLT